MTFKTDELISSTKLVRNFGSVLSNMKDNTISKIGVLKNNDLEAVIFSRNEYDKLQKYIEDLEDITLAEKRIRKDHGARYSQEEVARELWINLHTL